MRKSLIWGFCFVIPVTFILLSITSCSSSKKIKYFQDIPDSGRLKTIPSATYTEPTIQVDDILTVLVETVDPAATATINMGNVPTQSTGSAIGSLNPGQQVLSGYLVNKDGFIEVPVLGRMKMIGLTTNQARDTILKEAVKYYKDPTVILRYANFKFSVTGEVMKPGVYVTPNEKVTILDALALAGDLTVFGKRENVLLIRQNLDGTTTPYRINLLKSNIISSPYYYLRQNDLIYVEPGKGRAAATDAAQARTYTIIGAALSVLIILITRIK
jgi:polysaccharide export outer membrane protein